MNTKNVMPNCTTRPVLRNVYYRIETPEYCKSLNCTDAAVQQRARENVAAYECEIVYLLSADGWTLKPECMHPRHYGCPELSKGNQHLYCHPQSISGNVDADNIEHIETLLKGARTFSHYNTDQYEFVIVTANDADETALYHEEYDAKIFGLIQKYFTTKRRNLYKKTFQALWALYKHVAIRTTRHAGVLTSSDPGYKYVCLKYQQALAAGLIITAPNDLARWITKKEKPQINVADDLTADEIAYLHYLNGQYTYQDYLTVCETEECEPQPECLAA